MNKPVLYIIEFRLDNGMGDEYEWDTYVTDEKDSVKVAEEYTDFFKEEYDKVILDVTALPQKKWGTYRIELVNEMNID